MMTPKERLAFQNRKNRKKNQLQSSQEMINAVDKVSVSVRRAFNVNRCQQDHLDSKVWTLERECRKSLGMLSLEQRKFVKSRKPLVVRLKSADKTRKELKHPSRINNIGQTNALKKPGYLPVLVNGTELESNDLDFRKHRFSYEDGSKKLKERQAELTKQRFGELIRLPTITKPKSNCPDDLRWKEIAKPERANPDAGESIEWRNKRGFVSSFAAGKEIVDGKIVRKRKIYGNQKKLSQRDEFTKDSLKYVHRYRINGNQKASSSKNYTNSSVTQSWNNKSQVPLLLNSGNDSNFGSISDKTTEIRVKEFLKLPSIGGIYDAPEIPNDSDEHQFKSDRKKKFSTHPDKSGETRGKSSLWKNLVHCRYLRLNERYQYDKISDKTCECNWCSMMKKYKM